MDTLPSFIFLLFLGYLLLQALHSLRHGLRAKRLGKNTCAFFASPADTSQHFLVIGDSTAFGTGALDP